MKSFENLESSPFTKDDIQKIYNLYYKEDKSKAEITRIMNLSIYYVNKLIQSINDGVFDDIVNDDSTSTVDGNTVNIYDGISIEIHNHYTNDDNGVVKTNKPKKANRVNLGKWSKRIRERDGNICSVCGKEDKQHMEAHHIKPKSVYPDEALDDLNGICICQKCHQKYNDRYTANNQNAVTFARFIFEENRGF